MVIKIRQFFILVFLNPSHLKASLAARSLRCDYSFDRRLGLPCSYILGYSQTAYIARQPTSSVKDGTCGWRYCLCRSTVFIVPQQ